MSRRLTTWVRPALGVGILAVLGTRVGVTPLRDAIAAVSGPLLVVALLATGLTTVLSAWRWHLVSTAVGLRLSLGAATLAYYRSQFLNSVLPGGVLGDVHRGYRHGRDTGAVRRALRAVAWERSLGQGVHLLLTAVALVLLSTPRALVLPGAAAVAGALLICCGVAMGTRWHGEGVLGRTAAAVTGDLHELLRVRGRLGAMALASALAVCGHVTLFVVAARAAAVALPIQRLLPLALVVLTASAVPMNIAGWGPREGAAAWAFAASGTGAAQGVAVAALYGLMTLVATLPGALVLVASARGRTAPTVRAIPFTAPSHPTLRDARHA